MTRKRVWIAGAVVFVVAFVAVLVAAHEERLPDSVWCLGVEESKGPTTDLVSLRPDGPPLGVQWRTGRMCGGYPPSHIARDGDSPTVVAKVLAWLSGRKPVSNDARYDFTPTRIDTPTGRWVRFDRTY